MRILLTHRTGKSKFWLKCPNESRIPNYIACMSNIHPEKLSVLPKIDLSRANQGQLDSITSLWLTHQGSFFSHWMRTGPWADILGAEGEVMPEKGTSNEGEKLCLRHLIWAFEKVSPDARMGTPSHQPMHFLFLLKPVWTGFQFICHLTDIKWEKIWLMNVINLSSPSPNP